MATFRSEAGRKAYFAAYDAMLARWPVPAASRSVLTGLGATHVLEAGKADAAPVVLLPAVSVSATEWFANVAALAGHFHVFAVDIVGDAGKSVLTRRPSAPADYADWLVETFRGLELARPAIVGHSYGGWLALQVACHRPEAVDAMVLLAPAAGLVRFHWYAGLFLRVGQDLPFGPGARTILRKQAHKGFEPDELFVGLMEAMMAHVRSDVLFPGRLSDSELARIKARTLVLIGEEEVLYDPQAAIDRGRRLIPGATGHLIPGCSHLLNMERPDMVDRAIVEFLTASANNGAAA